MGSRGQRFLGSFILEIPIKAWDVFFASHRCETDCSEPTFSDGLVLSYCALSLQRMAALPDLAETVAVQVNVLSSGAGNAEALIRCARALSKFALEVGEGGAPSAAAVIENGGIEALVACMATNRDDLRQGWHAGAGLGV